MPTKRSISRNDVFSESTKAAIAASNANVPDQDTTYQSRTHENATRLYKVFADFCAFQFGYLKTRRDAHEDRLHYIFTWTQGEHHGSYVYVACPLHEMLEGLEILVRKVAEVELGERKPTPDRRNSNYRPASGGSK